MAPLPQDDEISASFAGLSGLRRSNSPFNLNSIAAALRIPAAPHSVWKIARRERNALQLRDYVAIDPLTSTGTPRYFGRDLIPFEPFRVAGA